MRGLESNARGGAAGKPAEHLIPISTPTHVRHSSQTAPSSHSNMLQKATVGHMSRKSGFDSSFAAQLAVDVATNSKVKRELEQIDGQIFRKDRSRHRDTDWNEIVRKQLFRDYPGKARPGQVDNDSKGHSNRSSSPFSLRNIEGRPGISIRPLAKTVGLAEQIRGSLGVAQSREDPFDELLIGAAKGKKLQKDTSELVQQLHSLKEEIKLVTDNLEQLVHQESAIISQTDPSEVKACEDLYAEFQGPGEQDLEMRIVNFSEEMEEIRQSKIPSAEQTLRYLEERRQQITSLMNSVNDEYFTEQAKSVIAKIEEFQKVKNRAVENVTLAEKSLNREIRMRLVEKADLVSEIEEKEYLLEQLRRDLAANLSGFQQLDGIFVQLQENRRLSLEGKRVVTVNKSRNASTLNIQSSSVLDDIHSVSSHAGTEQAGMLAAHQDSDRACRQFDEQISTMMEHLYSKIPAEDEQTRSSLEDYIGLQQDMRMQDQRIHGNIVTVESRLIPESRAAEKMVLLARFEVEEAKKVLFELVDEEEHLIGLYEQAMKAEEIKKSEIKATRFQKEQEEFDRLNKQDKKVTVQLQILRERVDQISTNLSQLVQVKEKLDFCKTRISAKQQIDKLRSKLDKLHVQKMEIDNTIIKINFLEEKPAVGGARGSSKSRSNSRRKKFQFSLPCSKQDLFEDRESDFKRFPGVSVQNLHALDLQDDQMEGSDGEYFRVKYDNEIGFPTFGKDHKDPESGDSNKAKYFSQEIIGSNDKSHEFAIRKLEPEWQNSAELEAGFIHKQGQAEIKLFPGNLMENSSSQRSPQPSARNPGAHHSKDKLKFNSDIFKKRSLIPRDYYERQSPESSSTYNQSAWGLVNHQKLFQDKQRNRNMELEQGVEYTDTEDQKATLFDADHNQVLDGVLGDRHPFSQSPSQTGSDERFRRGSNTTSLQLQGQKHHNRSKSIESQNISSVSRHILHSNLQSPSGLDALKWTVHPNPTPYVQDNSYFTQAFSKKGMNPLGTGSASKADTGSRKELAAMRSSSKHFATAKRTVSVSKDSDLRGQGDSQQKQVGKSGDRQLLSHRSGAGNVEIVGDKRIGTTSSQSVIQIDKRVKDKFRREIQVISSKVKKGFKSTEVSVVKKEPENLNTVMSKFAGSQGNLMSSGKLRSNPSSNPPSNTTKHQESEEPRQSTGIYIQDMKEPSEARRDRDSSLPQKEARFNPAQSYFLKKQSPNGNTKLPVQVNKTTDHGSADTWQLSNQNTLSIHASENMGNFGFPGQNLPGFHEAPAQQSAQPYSAASKRYLLAKTANYASGGVYSKRVTGPLVEKLSEASRNPTSSKQTSVQSNFKKAPSVDLPTGFRQATSSVSVSKTSRKSPIPQKHGGSDHTKNPVGIVIPPKPQRITTQQSVEIGTTRQPQLHHQRSNVENKKMVPGSDIHHGKRSEEHFGQPQTMRVLHRSELTEQLLGKMKGNSIYNPFTSRSKSPRQFGFKDYILKIETLNQTLGRQDTLLNLTSVSTHGPGTQASYLASQIEKFVYPSSTTDFLKRIKSSQLYVSPQQHEPKSDTVKVHLPITLSFTGGKKLDLVLTSAADLHTFRLLEESLGLRT